jgi:hypothetical protein
LLQVFNCISIFQLPGDWLCLYDCILWFQNFLHIPMSLCWYRLHSFASCNI